MARANRNAGPVIGTGTEGRYEGRVGFVFGGLGVKPPESVRAYDHNKPARVYGRKGELLWEGMDILDALRAFRSRGGVRIERDGVLLATAGRLSREEKLATELYRQGHGRAA